MDQIVNGCTLVLALGAAIHVTPEAQVAATDTAHTCIIAHLSVILQRTRY